MMRIAPAKAQALPSTIDERRAKIRKASLTTQKKSRDSSCFLSFSFCVFIAIILYSAARKPEGALISVGQEAAEQHIRRSAIDRPLNDGKLNRTRNRPRARHPIPLPRGPDIHRPLRPRPSGDLPPVRGRASRHALLFLPPAAKPQSFDPFGF